ncbi:MAG: hypothetical protein ACI9NQ_001938 [Paracoccaceae bacterium]|jgi:hypothetical protein
MSPERVFQILTTAGLIAGGWLYGDYLKKSMGTRSGLEEAATLRAENSELTQRVDELGGELAQVRSMLSKGPYPIPDDLVAWIEKDYNMVFLKAPDVRLASPATMRNAAETNLRFVHGDNGLEEENLAWELIGLLPPNHRLLGQMIMINSSVKGIFDLTKEQILISENFDPVSVPDRSVLARLLAQQLSFQNHPQKKWLNRDEWQAWQALHVGSSGALSARFLRRNSAADEAEYQDPEPLREQLLNDLPPAIQGFSNFPYMDGADYSRFFYIDSREAWAKMFLNPAKTTAEILHPNRDPIVLREITFAESPDPLKSSDQLGELGLRLWLEPFAGVLEAGPLAEEWRGDRYEVRERDQKLSLTWHVEMATEKAARSLIAEIERTLLTPLRSVQPDRDIQLSQKGMRVTFSNSPKTP